MSVSMYQRNVENLHDDLIDLTKESEKAVAKERQLIKDIDRIRGSITKNTSLSMQKSRLRQIDGLLEDLEKIRQQQTKLRQEIADKTTQLKKDQKKLEEALTNEEKKRSREKQSQLEKELKQSQAITAELNKISTIGPRQSLGPTHNWVWDSTRPMGVWTTSPTHDPIEQKLSLREKLRAAFPDKKPGTLENFEKIIKEYDRYEQGESYNNQEDIASAISLASSTFNNYLKQLRDAGFIRK